MATHSPIFMELGQGMSLMIGFPTINSWNTAGRPKNAKRGTFGWNKETNNLEYCDGVSWYAALMEEM